MHGIVNSNIFESLLKIVTPCDEKSKQTVATLVVYLTISSIVLELRQCEWQSIL